MRTVTLRHGGEMPRVGLGTWPMDDAEAETAVATAIAGGYRLIDTAENYGNEDGVGRGIRASGVARDQIFITTKLNKRWHGVDLVAEAVNRSADRLGVDYLDLILIHWPNPAQDRYVEAWQGLIALRDTGRVRAIGTSNFKPAHLRRLEKETGVLPEVNQIELSPFATRTASRSYHDENGIVTESWSPLGGSANRILRAPLIVELAARRDRSPAQIVLRWHLEIGAAPIPKSSNPERLAANLDVFDFALAPQEVAAISALDRGESTVVDSDSFGH